LVVCRLVSLWIRRHLGTTIRIGVFLRFFFFFVSFLFSKFVVVCFFSSCRTSDLFFVILLPIYSSSFSSRSHPLRKQVGPSPPPTPKRKLKTPLVRSIFHLYFLFESFFYYTFFFCFLLYFVSLSILLTC
jgi:hypothetical protein